jgi:hypothetical protein
MRSRPIGQNVTLLITYVAIGCTLAIAFVTVGIHHMDPQAKGSGLGFRLIVLPGVAALWPWVLYQWLHLLRRADMVQK